MLKIDEPAPRLFNQGMLHKEGVVMSKSKGNVVVPEEVAEKYGIDTARFFLLFVASPDKDMEWDDKGVDGSFRFLNKVYYLATEKKIVDKVLKNQESKLHKTIKEVTSDIENFRYNQALIKIMELTNYLYAQDEVSKEAIEKLLLIMAPITPHLSEELWEKLGNKPFISMEKWPKYDSKKIDATIEAQEAVIDKTIADVRSVLQLIKVEKPKKISLIVSAAWKYDVFKKIKAKMDETRNIGEIIKSVMDKDHGKEISQLVPRLVKNPALLPIEIIDQDKEIKGLQQGQEAIAKEFGCEVEIVKAEDSKESKAGNAMPSKPAIIVN